MNEETLSHLRTVLLGQFTDKPAIERTIAIMRRAEPCQCDATSRRRFDAITQTVEDSR